MGAPAWRWALRAARLPVGGGRAPTAPRRQPGCGPAAPFADSAVSEAGALRRAAGPLRGGRGAGRPRPRPPRIGPSVRLSVCVLGGGEGGRQEDRRGLDALGVLAGCVLAQPVQPLLCGVGTRSLQGVSGAGWPVAAGGRAEQGRVSLCPVFGRSRAGSVEIARGRFAPVVLKSGHRAVGGTLPVETQAPARQSVCPAAQGPQGRRVPLLLKCPGSSQPALVRVPPRRPRGGRAGRPAGPPPVLLRRLGTSGFASSAAFVVLEATVT